MAETTPTPEPRKPDPVARLLYELMKDHLPYGPVRKATMTARDQPIFTCGDPLANVARTLSAEVCESLRVAQPLVDTGKLDTLVAHLGEIAEQFQAAQTPQIQSVAQTTGVSVITATNVPAEPVNAPPAATGYDGCDVSVLLGWRDLTPLEVGRRWAAATNRAVLLSVHNGAYYWHDPYAPKDEHSPSVEAHEASRIPEPIFREMQRLRRCTSLRNYVLANNGHSEGDAYALLGEALMSLWEKATSPAPAPDPLAAFAAWWDLTSEQAGRQWAERENIHPAKGIYNSVWYLFGPGPATSCPLPNWVGEVDYSRAVLPAAVWAEVVGTAEVSMSIGSSESDPKALYLTSASEAVAYQRLGEALRRLWAKATVRPTDCVTESAPDPVPEPSESDCEALGRRRACEMNVAPALSPHNQVWYWYAPDVQMPRVNATDSPVFAPAVFERAKLPAAIWVAMQGFCVTRQSWVGAPDEPSAYAKLGRALAAAEKAAPAPEPKKSWQEMTDEEIGRAWARQEGKRPSLWDSSAVEQGWNPPGSVPKVDPSILPKVIFDGLSDWCRHGFVGGKYYPDEAKVYSELGRSLRQIWTQVVPLK